MKNFYLALLKNAKSFLLLLSGTVLIAFSTSIFILPFELVVGGVSGIALIINTVIPLGSDLWISVITTLFFIFGLVFLGGEFIFKSALSSLAYPVFVSIFSRLRDEEVLSGFFNLANTRFEGAAVIIAAVFGGVLTGIGAALAFQSGGSTGGVDVVAIFASRRSKLIKPSSVILAIDALVIILGAFASCDMVLSLTGLISAFITAKTLDKASIYLKDAMKN